MTSNGRTQAIRRQAPKGCEERGHGDHRVPVKIFGVNEAAGHGVRIHHINDEIDNDGVVVDRDER